MVTIKNGTLKETHIYIILFVPIDTLTDYNEFIQKPYLTSDDFPNDF